MAEAKRSQISRETSLIIEAIILREWGKPSLFVLPPFCPEAQLWKLKAGQVLRAKLANLRTEKFSGNKKIMGGQGRGRSLGEQP